MGLTKQSNRNGSKVRSQRTIQKSVSHKAADYGLAGSMNKKQTKDLDRGSSMISFFFSAT